MAMYQSANGQCRNMTRDSEMERALSSLQAAFGVRIENSIIKKNMFVLINHFYIYYYFILLDARTPYAHAPCARFTCISGVGFWVHCRLLPVSRG